MLHLAPLAVALSAHTVCVHGTDASISDPSLRDLRAPRWRRVRLGNLKPEGWLVSQMKLQASALSFHLPLFWKEVRNTSWLGGGSDNVGGLHESTPYWLNGVVPLAFQLDDSGLLEIVEHYIDGILDRQHANGWLGPETTPAESDFWSRYPLVLALAQYHEAAPLDSPRRNRIFKSMLKFFWEFRARLQHGFVLTDWSAARAHDIVWAIHYFVDVLLHQPAAENASASVQDLLHLAETLHEKGFDWHNKWFASPSFPQRPVTNDTLWTHGVNNAQSTKRGAVWARQSGNFTAGFMEAQTAWNTLMRYHWQPYGLFAADEHLAGDNPSRGTELCTVVESIWSLALIAQMADTDSHAVSALDRLEKIVFNALPGSLSDDLWSHPYLQFANSFKASGGESDHVWTHDGPDAAMYGLAPNYECCTSNFHQGYPKFLTHLFFEDPSRNALVSAVWAPSALTTRAGGGASVELRTEYPFGVSCEYHIANPTAFTLIVRIPEFLRTLAGMQTIKAWLEGHEQIVMLENGFMHFDIPSWPLAEPRLAVRIAWDAPARVERRVGVDGAATVSVFVGTLLMTPDLRESREAVKRYDFEAADWNISARSSWRIALPEERALKFGPVLRQAAGPKPYAHTSMFCPLVVNASVARLEDRCWVVNHGAPAQPPGPETIRGTPVVLEERTFIPYGCSSLHMAVLPELPLEEFDSQMVILQ